MNRLPALALRNVGRNARRSLITGLTIVAGVALAVMARGVTLGLANSMMSDAVEARLGALQVHKKGFVDNLDAVPTKLNLPYSDELKNRLRAVPHVTGVTGRITFNGLVSNGVSQTMFVGRGLDLAHETEACPRAKQQVAKGAMLETGDTAGALLGYELATSFNITPGKNVTLTSSSPGGRANSLDLVTRGLTVSNLPFENKRVVTVPLSVAQSLLGLDGRVTEYAIAIDDLSRLDEVKANLQAALGPEYEVHTWAEIQPFIRDLLYRLLWVLTSVGTVLFVVVLTGIVNTMLMSVFERVREIGTLLAVGVKRRQVLEMFLIEGAVIGLGGGLVGAIVGRLIVFGLAAKGMKLPVSGLSATNMLYPTVPVSFVVGSVLVAAFGAFLASLWPAWRASRLNPVDALRSN